MSNDKRNEGQLFSDVFGVESLVDEITYKLADDAGDEKTSSAILGPFWRKDVWLLFAILQHKQYADHDLGTRHPSSRWATVSSQASSMAITLTCTDE